MSPTLHVKICSILEYVKFKVAVQFLIKYLKNYCDKSEIRKTD